MQNIEIMNVYDALNLLKSNACCKFVNNSFNSKTNNAIRRYSSSPRGTIALNKHIILDFRKIGELLNDVTFDLAVGLTGFVLTGDVSATKIALINALFTIIRKSVKILIGKTGILFFEIMKKGDNGYSLEELKKNYPELKIDVLNKIVRKLKKNNLIREKDKVLYCYEEKEITLSD